MSAAATIERAAGGEPPTWARMAEARRAHAGRVAGVLAAWAGQLGLPPAEVGRWRAAGWLHDALRDEDPATLRSLVPQSMAGLPGQLLHGPAAAARLRDEGADDEELLDAVAFHTLGCEGFGRLGRALYCADFLEPGRTFEPVLRAALRARMPDALDDVTRRIVAARVVHLVTAGQMVRPETMGFWNTLARERT